jgi:hypothetical protein
MSKLNKQLYFELSFSSTYSHFAIFHLETTLQYSTSFSSQNYLVQPLIIAIKLKYDKMQSKIKIIIIIIIITSGMKGATISLL